MKNIFLSILLFFFLTSGHAQILISPFAGVSADASKSISFSGGEIIISTLKEHGNIITQGFQQPFLSTRIINNNKPHDLTFHGESPSQQKRLFGREYDGIKSISHFLIYNVSGQIIYQRKNFDMNELQHWWAQSYNDQSLHSGIYFYYIEYEELGQTQIQTGSVTKF